MGKLNGKATWSPPTEKGAGELWNLGLPEDDKPQSLDFCFTTDPIAFKKE